LEKRWNNFLLESIECLAVAEKCGHGNQQVGEQRLRLVRALAQDLVVFTQILGSGHLHAAGDPPHDRRALVLGEVVAGADAQMREHPMQRLLIDLRLLRRRCGLLDADQLRQTVRELTNGQDEVGNSGGNGAARHGCIFSFARLLHENNAAGFFHRAHTDGAVRAGAAENHSEPIAKPLGDRAKEKVNRSPLALRLLKFQR